MRTFSLQPAYRYACAMPASQWHACFLLACIVLPSLLMGCGREKVVETFPNNKPKVIRTYGLWGGTSPENLKREQVFSVNGHKEKDTYFSKGLRHGAYFDYWHNGQKKSEGRFTNGQKVGTWTFFYNQFTISAKGDFKANQKEGVWRQFWENGDAKAIGSFKAGKEVDTLKEWDAKGQQLVENSCFESNELGYYRTFHANQTVKEDYACQKGVPVGAYARKDPDGMIIEKGAFDPDGKKTGIWETFGADGKRASLKHYQAGMENDSSYSWDAAGRLLERGFFVSGTGERLRYDSLNHLVERQHFAESHPEGEAWVYYPSGSKRSLMLYKQGQPASLQKWHPNGNLKLTGLYLGGQRTGDWLEYGANGKLLESSQYQAGVLHGDQLFYDSQGKLMRKMRYEHGYPAEGKIPASIAR